MLNGLESRKPNLGYCLPKSSRLSSRKRIKALMASKTSFYKYPVKVFFLEDTSQESGLLATVPKKRIKLATDRNRIKRLIRESFRCSKYREDLKGLSVGVVYIAKNSENKKIVDKGLAFCLSKMVSELKERQV